MSSALAEPFGKLPEGWSYQAVEKNTVFLTGPAFDSTRFNMEGFGSKLVRGINLTKGSTRWHPDKTKYWNDNLNELEKYSLSENDILVGMDGSLVGQNYAYIKKSDLPALLVQRVARLRANSKLNSKFLFYIYGADSWLTYVETVKTNSGIPHISNGDIKKFNAPFPPLPEQKKIATILSTVDEVIEKTQAQIDKLKDLKTGMMQELLSKGVGVDGKPHTEFKDSPVGRIPVGWEVVSLGNTGNWRGGGTPSKANKDYWGGNIPWVSPKDMKTEFINRTQDSITEDAVTGSSTNLIEKDSILMVVRSGILQHTLPLAIASRKLTINQDMKALTVTDGYSAKFIYNYLLANNHKVLRATLKAGNTVESIDFNEFSKYLIPSPPYTEQEEIAQIIDSIANKIRKKDIRLVKYKNLKKALMQDLLTGKVRVKVTDNTAANS